jgi:hypothetical protein
MARKKIYVIAAMFQMKYIIRFVVCSGVTESRDIVFAWEEIRSQADQVLGDEVDNEPDNLPHKKHNGVAKDVIGISNGNGSTMNGTYDEPEILPVNKKRKNGHEDKPGEGNFVI